MKRLGKGVIKGALVLALFGLLVVFLSSEAYFFTAVGHKVNFWNDFLYNAARWMPWALFTPLILWLARRLPLARRRWARLLAVHLPLSLVLAVAEVGIVFGIHVLTRWKLVENTPLGFTLLLAKYIHYNVLAYWVILGIGLTMGTYRKFHEQQLASSRLEAELARANLQVLKMQIHPHFLFNTLHAISALIPKDPAAADAMISRLSDLLRVTVEQSGLQEVPWRQEQEALDRYLDIMRVRLGHRLKIRFDVSEEAREALMPSFLLQPLLENAVRYGISSRPEGGEIVLRAARKGADLILTIEDDGPGFQAAPEAVLRQGMGLANTAERLRSLYGRDQSLTLENRKEGGARVVVRLPFRPA